MKLKNKTKNSIAYIAVFMSVFLPIVLSIQNWFQSEELIVLAAETTTAPLTSNSPGQVESVEAEPVVEFENPVEEYIYEVFGEHYDKAMILLKGKDGGCAENRGLNPYAVNDNTTWGGVGRDRGVFQINDVYHPLTDEQAFDYKQNVDYAWRMYKNDNFTFRRWTCGRHWGI